MTIAIATNAPATSNPATAWLDSQPDVIRDGKCGCVMRLQRCLDRQRMVVRDYSDGQRNVYGEAVREEYIGCVGCRYFGDPNPEDQTYTHRKATAFGRRRSIMATQRRQRAFKADLASAHKALINKNPEAWEWRETRVAQKWKLRGGGNG